MSIDRDEYKKNIETVLSRYTSSYDVDSRLVTLFDLVDQVYSLCGYSKEEIYEFINGDNSKNNLRDFIGDINGCFSEARVGRCHVDVNGYAKPFDEEHIPDNWYDIKLDVGTSKNPLLFITNNKPVDVPKFDISDGSISFIVFSDLHLEEGCYNPNGSIDEVKLASKVENFLLFQNWILDSCKDLNLGGVVFTGDILDVNKKYVINPVNSRTYCDQIISGINKAKRNGSVEFASSDVVFGIVGNHEAMLDTSLDVCCERVEEITKELFGSSSSVKGVGSSRIRVGDSFISIQHPNSNDSPILNSNNQFEDNYLLRRSEFEAVTMFDKYLMLCNKAAEDLRSQGKTVLLTGFTREKLNEVNIFDYVNNKLAIENPELYEYFVPFITSDMYYVGNIHDKDLSRKTSFFASHIDFSSDKNREFELERNSTFRFFIPGVRGKIEMGLNIEGYNMFFRRNKILRNNVLYGYNPFYSRNDDYGLSSEIVAHLHSYPEEFDIVEPVLDESGNVVKKPDGTDKTNVYHMAGSVVLTTEDSFEGKTPVRATALEPKGIAGDKHRATVVTLKISDGLIEQIEFGARYMIVKDGNVKVTKDTGNVQYEESTSVVGKAK